MNKDPVKIIEEKYDVRQIRQIFSEGTVHQIPIIDDNVVLKDVVYKTDISGNVNEIYMESKLSNPVVIMAGGKGARLDPFTRVLPKALIPVGEKPIIEIIMDEFAKYGMTNFIISINHKAKMIKAYLEDFKKDYSIKYINEDKPLGTAGVLKCLEGEIKTPFFVSNCDVLIKSDYYSINKFHRKGNYALTLVGSTQFHIVPYGVCEIDNGGELKKIVEKPEFDFLANTGMYIINPEVLRYIPKAKSYHMTELIGILKTNNEKVGVFPISEKSWIDVGQWEEYKKAIEYMSKYDEG